MTRRLALSGTELGIVTDILRKHLPKGISVHVFGSRALGIVKRRSDLDLVLEAAAPLPLALIAELAEAFEESDLPWKVDLVDRKAVSAEFSILIDRSKMALPLVD